LVAGGARGLHLEQPLVVLGPVAAELLQEHVAPAAEHGEVPVVPAARQELLRPPAGRLLDEPGHPERVRAARADRLARLDISEAGRGVRGLEADSDELAR